MKAPSTGENVGSAVVVGTPVVEVNSSLAKVSKEARNAFTTTDSSGSPSSQNCDSLKWRFSVYVSSTGRNDTQKEIDRLSDVAKEFLRARVKYLAETDKIDWNRPEAAKLKGVEDVYEIRFKADSKQYRPFGCFGPDHDEFTVLIFAIKKGDRYDPTEAIDTAATRRKALLKGESSRVPLQIDGEDVNADEEDGG